MIKKDIIQNSLFNIDEKESIDKKGVKLYE